MTQYPYGVITENLYTVGNKFILDEKPYIGRYHQIENKYYTGSTHDSNSKELILLYNYIKNKVVSNIPYNPNKQYFIKKNNDTTIKKTSASEYNKVKNDPLYVTVEVDITNPNSISNANKLLPDLNLTQSITPQDIHF